MLRTCGEGAAPKGWRARQTRPETSSCCRETPRARDRGRPAKYGRRRGTARAPAFSIQRARRAELEFAVVSARGRRSAGPTDRDDPPRSGRIAPTPWRLKSCEAALAARASTSRGHLQAASALAAEGATAACGNGSRSSAAAHGVSLIAPACNNTPHPEEGAIREDLRAVLR